MFDEYLRTQQKAIILTHKKGIKVMIITGLQINVTKVEIFHNRTFSDTVKNLLKNRRNSGTFPAFVVYF